MTDKRRIIMFTFPDMSRDTLQYIKVELEKLFGNEFDIMITNREFNTISVEDLQKFFDDLKEKELIK